MPFQLDEDKLPLCSRPEQAEVGFAKWQERQAREEDAALAAFMADLAADPLGRRLLSGIFANSRFLSQCAITEVATFAAFFGHTPGRQDSGAGKANPDPLLSELHEQLKTEVAAEVDTPALWRNLRRYRRRSSFIIGLADITQTWRVPEVLTALSETADHHVSAALAALLRQAAGRGELYPRHESDVEKGCGYVLLGLGKLGAGELNFSSDIDLIAIFDPERIDYHHRRGPQEGCIRLTRDLGRLLEERTADGFVYRTDFRLRPDPGAMPLAVSYLSALTYYESLGQNWERAAMIKARPIAGDLELGYAFLRELRPFVWRNHLDFYAIQDIHSIKRQINAQKGGSTVAIAGHNIKLGRGGIREIEFFAQTQQLIWGGRDHSQRSPKTIDALAALAAAGQITQSVADNLTAAYYFLRRVENHLQLVDEQQTHKLPTKTEDLAALAAFLGFPDRTTFEAKLTATLRLVEDAYAHLFEEAADLSGPGNLVFTGGEPEPETVETLEGMGFGDGAKVFELVRGWHHGRYRATRSTRSRQYLTELMPALLEALSKTLDPDRALIRLDKFLAGLPAGVQFFATLQANPTLLKIIAEIMGGAPLLAEQLGAHPGLLDAVLDQDFVESFPSVEGFALELAERLHDARDFQDTLDITQRWAEDRRFRMGIAILRAKIDVDETGRALSDIADVVLKTLYPAVVTDLARRHGQMSGDGMAIVAMGKLGGQEMTVSSDLDLVFLYDPAAAGDTSDGEKPLAPSQYYARLSQRYISAVTAKTAHGQLYEIDMRLRPSGNAGPIATPLSGYMKYYGENAWTWEHMALIRARVVASAAPLRKKIEAGIREILLAPRDPEKLLRDIAQMRQRIEGEKPAKTIWSVKYLRGGLVDLEFLAQYLQLRHAHEAPSILATSTQAAFAKLEAAGIIDSPLATALIEATRFFRQVQGCLRLTVGPAFDADSLPEALQSTLARAAGMSDFMALRSRLLRTSEAVHQVFIERLEAPAEALEAAEAAALENEAK